jgi:hypothetical protein
MLTQSPPRLRLSLWHKFQQALFAETWEELCRLSVAHLDAESCPLAQYGPWKPAARYWRGNEPEWDIVAESLSGDVLLLGEAKWSKGKVTKATVQQVVQTSIAKGIPPHLSSKKRRVVYALFVPQTSIQRPDTQGVCIVNARDVITSLR